MPQNKAKYCQNIALICLILTSSLINSPLQAQDISHPQTATLYLLSQEDPKTKAERLSQEGIELYQQGTTESLQKAIVKWQEALPLYRQLKDRSSEADNIYNIGRAYDDLGENQKALEYYQQALPLYREVDDRFGESIALNDIGYVYNALGENQKALEYYQQALSLCREIDDRSGEARTLNNIGNVYGNLGEKQTALEYLQQSLLLRRELDNKEGEAITLNNIGKVYDDLGEKQKALEYYQQTLPVFRAVYNQKGEAIALNNIGKVYDDLGEKQKALEYYQQSLTLSRAVGDRAGEAITLNNLGVVYDTLGEKQKALEYLQQSLPLRRAVGDRAGEARTLNNIAGVYNALGEKQKALEYYQQALPLSRAVGDRSDEAITLNNLGVVYNALEEKQKALEYYQQALPLSRAVGDRANEALVLNNIGAVYEALGEKQKALEYHRQALPLSRAVGDRFNEAVTLNNIGKAYEALGEKQKALEYYQQSLSLSRAVGNKEEEANTLRNIARTQKETGNLQESLTNIEAAIAIIEDLRTKIVDTDLRQTYFASVQDYYQFYIDLLMELDKQNPKSGYDAKAFNASERMRGRSLLELLTEANTDIREGVDPTLLQQEKELNQKLDTIEKRRVQANTTATTQTVTDKIEKERLDLISQYKALQTKIRSNSPRYANLKQPQPIELKQLQEQILDADTILLQYSLGEDRSFLWAITKEGYTAYELPKRQIIEDAAKNYHGLVANVSEQKLVDESAIKLSDIILKPAASQLTKKRIVVVGDGALLYVPFQSLPLPNTTNKNLLQNYEIINLPSSSTISILREDLKNRKAAPKSIGIFADPIFNPNDERITNKNTSNNNNTEQTLDELALNRSVRNSDVSLERLLGTRKEAEVIAKLFPENNRVLELDFDANRTNATSKNLNQYKILHFATHGLLNSENPELSGIVMSLFDINGNPVNGYLRLNDIFNLNLNADLVVLSACETGLGKEVKGEGLIGLTRGFMYAGASRLVISLWSVDDEATADLMSRFYTKMSKENLSPQVALRQAQLEIQQIPKWSHPFFWAGFVIQGEWE